MDMTLPTEETLNYWKQEIEATSKSTFPHSTAFGYYRTITGRENGGTFTDLVPLPTETSLRLIENMFKKQNCTTNDIGDIDEEEESAAVINDNHAPYTDLPPCLKYKYFYPTPTTLGAMSSLSQQEAESTTTTTPKSKKTPKANKSKSAAAVNLDFSIAAAASDNDDGNDSAAVQPETVRLEALEERQPTLKVKRYFVNFIISTETITSTKLKHSL
jgi:hypothetical protein